MNMIASAMLGACTLYFFLIGDFLMFKIALFTIVFLAVLEIVLNYLRRKH